ncbi:hypothetical protein DFH09DRAFT_906355 [Mycena vulgaris]|nr:hypothetical protein DFH09DRAFT_906355 [Mycena vulgaris]
MAATVDAAAPTKTAGIPKVSRTERFPYRHNGTFFPSWCAFLECNGLIGKACFAIENDKWIRGEYKSEAQECTKCDPAVSLTSQNNQPTLGHNGGHILFDPSILESDQPCGLFLRPFPMCIFELRKTGGGTRQIDWRRSTCLNPLKFKMAAAKTSTKNSPCTNYLIPCPLQCGRAVWTYNLDAHCSGSPHNLPSLDSIPRVYQMAPEEMHRMEELWLDRDKHPTKRNLLKKSVKPLIISAAPRSRNAVRCVLS